jgi:hypothetical protein
MRDEDYISHDQLVARIQRFHDILWKDYNLFSEIADLESDPILTASYAAQQETIQKLIDEYAWLFESITVRDYHV